MKFLQHIPAFLCVAAFMLACNSNTNESASQGSTTQKVAYSFPNTPVAKKLANFYHDNPSSQQQIDENKLIEFAVEKNFDVKRTNSGLFYVIEQTNKSPNFTPNQPIKADYRGQLLNGTEFDSSYKRGKPIAFNVGQMIPGWNEALVMMNRGSKAKLLIPSHLAYGKRGFPGLIGPDEPLFFQIEIPESFE